MTITTAAPTAAQRLADRIGQISPQRVRAIIDQIEQGTYPGLAGEHGAIVVRAARQNLATRTDRFWISNVERADGLARVVDQAHQRVAFVCHPDTARQWLAWYTGATSAHNPAANVDYRVCACGRLSATHDSHNADGAFVGIGNGGCDITRCTGFRPVVARPASIGA